MSWNRKVYQVAPENTDFCVGTMLPQSGTESMSMDDVCILSVNSVKVQLLTLPFGEKFKVGVLHKNRQNYHNCLLLIYKTVEMVLPRFPYITGLASECEAHEPFQRPYSHQCMCINSLPCCYLILQHYRSRRVICLSCSIL